ncbi:hypothetical protein HDV02_001876 [Globomyces sp. JEL0801]|nr:hypothetical protein HDV02_001876 [Globomyces sp. JEL0801]
MIESSGPFVISILSAIILLVLPIFVSGRLVWLIRDMSLSRGEQNIQISIITTLCIKLLNEILKAIFFGLDYHQGDTTTGAVGSVLFLILANWLTELSHIFTVIIVLIRTNGLIITPKAVTDENRLDVRVVVSYFLVFTRIVMPFLFHAFGMEINSFGIYQIYALFFELLVYMYATFSTAQYLRKLQDENKISLPTWLLYSNPISTGVLSFVAMFFMFIIGVANNQLPQSAITADVTPNATLNVSSSIYSVLVALVFSFFYHDTKLAIQTPYTPNHNKGMRRVKFSMAAIIG